jgi:hypothetical protein
MNSYNPRIMNERSTIIQIPKTNPTNMKEMFNTPEYSLKQNFFDPSKRSPPNEFMLKLKLRISLLSE